MSVKISELPILDSLADNDVIAGVDTSANVTSKIEMATLKNYIDTNTQYTAGTNIDITNNVVSAPNVYNKSETNELLEAKDKQIEKLQEELDAVSTIYNAFPTVDDEDESMTLDGTAETKLKKLDLKGNTSQETTTGINILAPTTATNPQSSNGITRTTNPDGSVTLTGTATANSYLRISNNLTLESNTNYTTYNANGALPSGVTLYYNNNENIGQVYTGTNITPGNTLKAYTTGTVTGTVSIAVLTQSGTTINATIYPMLVKGTYTVQTMPDYEPYTGGKPAPNPDFPEDVHAVSGDNKIKICGKNILDTSSMVMGDLNNNTGANVANTNKTHYRSDFIKVLPNTQYTFATNYTYPSNSVTKLMEYGEDKSFVQRNSSSSSNEIITFTTNSNTYYMKICMYSSSAFTDFYSLENMLVKGDDTTYEPYTGNTYPLYLGVTNLFDKNSVSNGYIDADGTVGASPDAYRTSDFIPVQPNTSYYKTLTESPRTKFFNANKQPLNTTTYQDVSIGGGAGTFTTPANAYYFRFSYPKSSVDANKIQVEKGTKGNSYTEFGVTPIELCKIGDYQDSFRKSTGKNLLDISTTEVGKAWNNNTASNRAVVYIKAEPNTTYTISYQTKNENDAIYYFEKINKTDTTNLSGVNAVDFTRTITTTASTEWLGIQFNKESITYENVAGTELQIEKSSVSTEYEPYGKVWYLHKEIGKVVLNGSENWQVGSSATNRSVFSNQTTFADRKNTSSYRDFYCDNFSYLGNAQGEVLGYAMSFNSGQYARFIYVQVPLAVVAQGQIDDFKNWLSIHKATVYYILETPISITITDPVLIAQLDTLKNATSYEGQTNIAQENNHEPFILDVEAIEKLS